MSISLVVVAMSVVLQMGSSHLKFEDLFQIIPMISNPLKVELDKMVKERTYHVKWQVKVSQITRSIAARLKRKTTVD